MHASLPVPPDPAFVERVRASFERQTIMATIGATLTRVEPGWCEIVLPCRPDLCQQHGFVHAGVVTTIVDSACGYAAATLMPTDAGVLTIELKANFLAPADGLQLRAVGRVVKAGRTITVATGDVWALDDAGAERHVAMITATLMTIRDRASVVG